ncbi:MAG: hypothetical protein GKR77_05705 [Legionellales bacterium]|nr:hypothetical protein [Legionellales bacterium]
MPNQQIIPINHKNLGNHIASGTKAKVYEYKPDANNDATDPAYVVKALSVTRRGNSYYYFLDPYDDIGQEEKDRYEYPLASELTALKRLDRLEGYNIEKKWDVEPDMGGLDFFSRAEGYSDDSHEFSDEDHELSDDDRELSNDDHEFSDDDRELSDDDRELSDDVYIYILQKKMPGIQLHKFLNQPIQKLNSPEFVFNLLKAIFLAKIKCLELGVCHDELPRNILVEETETSLNIHLIDFEENDSIVPDNEQDTPEYRSAFLKSSIDLCHILIETTRELALQPAANILSVTWRFLYLLSACDPWLTNLNNIKEIFETSSLPLTPSRPLGELTATISRNTDPSYRKAIVFRLTAIFSIIKNLLDPKMISKKSSKEALEQFMIFILDNNFISLNSIAIRHPVNDIEQPEPSLLDKIIEHRGSSVLSWLMRTHSESILSHPDEQKSTPLDDAGWDKLLFNGSLDKNYTALLDNNEKQNYFQHTFTCYQIFLDHCTDQDLIQRCLNNAVAFGQQIPEKDKQLLRPDLTVLNHLFKNRLTSLNNTKLAQPSSSPALFPPSPQASSSEPRKRVLSKPEDDSSAPKRIKPSPADPDPFSEQTTPGPQAS